MIYLSPAVVAIYGIDVPAMYRQFFQLTGDPIAASNLVLASVQAEQKPEEPLLDSAQAAKILGVSTATAQALARAGDIRFIKVGKLVKFRREFLDEYLRPKPRKGAHW